MPKGYRCALIAAFGWLAVAASPPGQSPSSEQAQEQRAVADALNSVSAAIERTNKPDESGKPCREGENNRNSDLCAQWKAADAAEASALWTERAFWLGIAGAIIGSLTLAAAVAAASYAKRAADSAAHSVRSTEKGLRQIERQSRRELRAYITVKQANLGRDHLTDPPHAWVRLVNTGQTPAYEVSATGVVVIAEEEPEQLRFNMKDQPRVIMGRDVEYPMQVRFRGGIGLPAETPKTRTYVFGEVRYTDIFNQTWCHQFALVSDRAMGANGLTSCQHGNRESRFKR